jgi:hypothetical protein
VSIENDFYTLYFNFMNGISLYLFILLHPSKPKVFFLIKALHTKLLEKSPDKVVKCTIIENSWYVFWVNIFFVLYSKIIFEEIF